MVQIYTVVIPTDSYSGSVAKFRIALWAQPERAEGWHSRDQRGALPTPGISQQPSEDMVRVMFQWLGLPQN